MTHQSDVSYLRFRGVTKFPTQACTIPIGGGFNHPWHDAWGLPHKFESFGPVPWQYLISFFVPPLMMATRNIVVTTLVIVAIVAVLFATYASCRNHHLKCGAPPRPPPTGCYRRTKSHQNSYLSGQGGEPYMVLPFTEIIGINWEDFLSDTLSLFVPASLFGIPSSHNTLFNAHFLTKYSPPQWIWFLTIMQKVYLGSFPSKRQSQASLDRNNYDSNNNNCTKNSG